MPDVVTMADARAQRKVEALTAYRMVGTVRGACRLIHLHQDTWYKWKREDPNFASKIEDYRDIVADDLEEEAIRRAKNGSDLLMIFLLKGHKPEKYRERGTTHINVTSPVLESVFQRAAAVPLGPAIIDGVSDRPALEAQQPLHGGAGLGGEVPVQNERGDVSPVLGDVASERPTEG